MSEMILLAISRTRFPGGLLDEPATSVRPRDIDMANDSRRRIFPAQHRSSKEIVAAAAIAECVDLDLPIFIAREDQASAFVEEGCEPDLER